jgi:hypothetical protein
MYRSVLFLSFWACATLLGACGGHGSGTAAMPATPAPPARGVLLQTPPLKLATYAPGDLLALLGGSDLGKQLLQLAYTPRCTIDVHQIKYQTVDPAGAGTPASGALMVPSGSDPACTGTRPILLYAHGTSTNRNFNIADIHDGSNTEGLFLAAVFAAQGYIVVAPNYAGYDSSTLDYHPYLIADQQSKDMIDALAAARSALPTSSAPATSASAKLFVTGYSEGGYVAMATHRAMQSAGATVSASAPMSGPYALSAFGDAIFEGEVSGGAPVNATLLVTAYQRVYGNLYAQPTDLFEAKYAPTIEGLLPSTSPVSQLRAAGKLPDSAIFSSTPPDPAYASFTPATAPAALAPAFAIGFGTDFLITNAYRLGFLQDAQKAPDGSFPAATDGLPPSAPMHPLRQDLKTNDLRTWSPSAPVLLCGGDTDPTVFFFNTQLMQQYWTAHPASPAPVVLDVDAGVTAGDPYASIKKDFAIAKDVVRAKAVLGGATDGGDAAVLEVYHAGLVPPFCISAVKSFFDAL